MNEVFLPEMEDQTNHPLGTLPLTTGWRPYAERPTL